MRIIEPNTYQHGQKSKRSPRHILIGLGIAAVVVIGGVYGFATTRDANSSSTKQEAVIPEVQIVAEETDTPVEKPINEDPPIAVDVPSEELTVEPVLRALRQFGDNDFKIFYDQLKQKGVSSIENPLPISGNVAADERIQTLAEDRGYRLRGTPTVDLKDVDGYPVQPDVVQPWLDLKKAAVAEGHTINIVSAYRSTTHQKTLFLSRLAATGATIAQVASGDVDDKVNEVLITSSVPGYSKHHTGYTIDILCAGWAFENFKNSPCNKWISASNFEAAKRHGFIPSYPPEATSQGPDPEAWEYVWVGVDLLYE